MIKRALAFMLFLASPALAIPVEVTSGEHDGFTRIVLNFGAQTDWEFGRTVDGYRFRPIGKSGEYNLRPVFDKIGKSRLAAISANAETSELDIGFACACHAIPFEFRPGIIVIDLRDGAPPKGSSFEEPLDAPSAQPTNDPLASLEPTAEPFSPEPAGFSAGTTYNWLDRFTTPSEAPRMAQNETLAPQPSTKPDLQPLREQLLRQLSRGASEGVIDLALPENDGPIPPKAEVEAARVALGAMKGVETKTPRSPEKPMGAEGAECLPSAALNIMDWGGEGATNELLAQDMLGMVGEFDAPIPDGVTKAAQTRLFLGFGAEARLVLQAFPASAEYENALLALSHIIDGEDDPTQAFEGQGDCNTAAALWAVLSDEKITQSSQVATESVILAFSGLPEHLRRLIGPVLVDRMLELGDEATASTVRNMVLRATDTPSTEIAVMQAEVDLAKGDAAAAEAHLDVVEPSATISSAQALITRVKARIAQDLPVDETTLSALAALQYEMQDTDIGSEIATAMIYAEAAAGHYAAAFEHSQDLPNERAVIWRLMSKLADDSALLSFAIPPPTLPISGLTSETATTIAQRVLGLGLADAALEWAGLGGAKSGPLVAKIHLARRDGRAALAALNDDTSTEAAPLRGAAFELLGDYTAAAAAFAEVAPDAEANSLARARDWTALANERATQWSDLARDLTAAPKPSPDGVDTFGPLARGLALAEQSAATRGEIEKLLGNFNTAAPAAP